MRSSRKNLELLASFELEPVASPSAASWAGVTFGEYARTWALARGRPTQHAGDDARRPRLSRTRAVALCPLAVTVC